MTNPKEVLKQFIDFVEQEIGYVDGACYQNNERDARCKQFIISSQISTLTSQLEAIPEDEEIGHILKCNLCSPKCGINQERQRQRQALQLAIKEWTELK